MPKLIPRNVKTTDFIFNKAAKIADKYRNVELDLWKKMMRQLPSAVGLDLSEWSSLAHQGRLNFLQDATKYMGKITPQLQRDLENDMKRTIRETTAIVDDNLKELQEAVPTFKPPFTATDRFAFAQGMNDKSFSILQDMNTGVMNAASRVLPQMDTHFTNLINNTVVRVNNGQSLGKAVGATVKKMADNNLHTITYSNGRTVSAKHYVEMNTRTNLLQAHLDTQKSRMQEYGLDLVQISEHFDSSELCEPWQGGVYSLNGGSTQYQPLDDAIDGGLYHINCRHMQFPFVEGISDPPPHFDEATVEKQRSNRVKYNKNKNKIFKAEKNIAAKKHLSANQVLRSEKSLASATAENLELQATQDILTSQIEVENLEQVVVNSDGMATSLPINQSFFQATPKFVSLTEDEWLKEVPNWGEIDSLEKTDIKYDRAQKWMQETFTDRNTEMLKSPILEENFLAGEARETNLALGTKFSKEEKEILQKTIDDVYKQVPEMKNAIPDIRVYNESIGKGVGGDYTGFQQNTLLKLNTRKLDYADTETFEDFTMSKLNRGGGVRKIRLHNEGIEWTQQTTRHEMYHAMDNFESQVEHSLKQEQKLQDILTDYKALKNPELSQKEEFIRKLQDQKMRIQVKRHAKEFIEADGRFGTGNYAELFSADGEQSLKIEISGYGGGSGDGYFSEQTKLTERLHELLQDAGVEKPHVWIRENISDYALTNDSELWAELQAHADVKVNTWEKEIPGIKDWIENERITARERIQKKLEEYKSWRSNGKMKDIQKEMDELTQDYFETLKAEEKTKVEFDEFSAEDLVTEQTPMEKAIWEQLDSGATRFDYTQIDPTQITDEMWAKLRENQAAAEEVVEPVIVPEEQLEPVEDPEVYNTYMKPTEVKEFLATNGFTQADLDATLEDTDLNQLLNYQISSSFVNKLRNLENFEGTTDLKRLFELEKNKIKDVPKLYETDDFKLFYEKHKGEYLSDETQEELKVIFKNNNVEQIYVDSAGRGFDQFQFAEDAIKEQPNISSIIEKAIKTRDYQLEEIDYFQKNITESAEKLTNAIAKSELQENVKTYRAMLDDEFHKFLGQENTERYLEDLKNSLEELNEENYRAHWLYKRIVPQSFTEYIYGDMADALSSELGMEDSVEVNKILNRIRAGIKSDLEGSTIIDNGFMSTSTSDKLLRQKAKWPNFWRKRQIGYGAEENRQFSELVRFEVDVPKGQESVYLDKDLQELFKKRNIVDEDYDFTGQQELLLQRGLKMEIKEIVHNTDPAIKQNLIVKLRVVPKGEL